MKKTFRISFDIEELMTDSFLKISSALEVAIGKAKMLLALDRQYEFCKTWINEYIEEED